MSDRKNPFIEIGFPEYAGIHMMPFGLLERAAKHENARQRAVVSVILELHMMALIDVIKKNTRVSLDGAHFQSLKGSDDADTEAAHCVPRQILLKGKPADEAFKSPADAFRLKALFGETDILPVNFNKCDSRAERNGLADGFLEACKMVVTSAHFGGVMSAGSISVAVSAAYSMYETYASKAFNASVSRMREKLRPAKLNHREKVKWTEQLLILERYIETMREGGGKADGLALSRITGLIVVYNLIKADPNPFK